MSNIKFSQFCVIVVILHLLLPDSSESSDPHESIARRTPSGIPFYMTSPVLHSTFYSTVGLVILEVEIVGDDGSNSTSKSRDLTRFANFFQDNKSPSLRQLPILDCKIRDIFPSLYLSQSEKIQFYQQLASSCYSDKFQRTTISISTFEQEHSAWRAGLRDCKSRKIPDSFIVPSRLNSTLQKFTVDILNPADLQPSLPLSGLSAYYKKEIASCVFTENSFIIAIQIPLVSNSEEDADSWKSYRITPIPLWIPSEPDTVCRLQDRATYTVPEKIYHYKSSTRTLIQQDSCEMSGSEFCLLSDVFMERSMRRSCVQAIIESKDEDIVCIMKCEPSATYNFPIIRQLASDRYLIVHDLKSSGEVRVECPPFQKEEILTFPLTGALEIVLPCDCHVRYMSVLFKAGNPCGAEFSKISVNFPGVFDNREGILD